MPREQAREIANAVKAAQADVNSAMFAELKLLEDKIVVIKAEVKKETATKWDLHESHTKLENAIGLLKTDIALLEQRAHARFTLLQWMLGVTLAGVGAIFAKLFF